MHARHRRWPWIVVAAVLGALVVVVGIPTVLFLTREDPGARSAQEALDEFRSESTAPRAADGARHPEVGVYTARGEGREAVSFPPMSQDDGDEMPMTVFDEGDGCWGLRIDFNVAHWQRWRFCPTEEGTWIETAGWTSQRWDVGAMTIENLTTFECPTPAVVFDPRATPGTTWSHRCEGGNSQIEGLTISEGPYELLATDEELQIGDTRVTADRYRRTRTLSGGQVGTQIEEVWLLVDTGLPVRAERNVRVDTDTPVGAITYTEEGWWQLDSLSPTR